jgi:hypothetical protein
MKDKFDPRTAITLLATMLSWALMSLLFVIFYSACFNPAHQVLIDVNNYGEMTIEAVIFALIWGLTTWNILMTWKKL